MLQLKARRQHQKPKKAAPPPPRSKGDEEDDEDDEDEYEEPGAADGVDYMVNDGEAIDDDDPNDDVTTVLMEEEAESPIKNARKKRAETIRLTPKQEADIVQHVKTHPVLYDCGKTEFHLKHIRDAAWEQCAIDCDIKGK